MLINYNMIPCVKCTYFHSLGKLWFLRASNKAGVEQTSEAMIVYSVAKISSNNIYMSVYNEKLCGPVRY